MKPKVKRVSFSLDPILYQEFRATCMEYDVKMSVILDQLINDFLFYIEMSRENETKEKG